MTRLWLDDNRPAPTGWTWCHSVNEAIALASTNAITYMSLDHDLGDYAHDGGDGTRFTDWLADPANNAWPTEGIRVHSHNNVGAPTMLTTIDTYSHFPRAYSNTRGETPPGGWPPATINPT